MNPANIQSLIHKLEVGVGARIVWGLAILAAVMGLGVLYDLHQFHEFSNPEAMDSAQVARNLADGRGFSTDFIRPFSIYLLQNHNQALNSSMATGTNAADLARLNGPHPDLANAPVYPFLLAGMMKTWDTNVWQTTQRGDFWTRDGAFQRYKPEFRIALLNQLLLLAVVGLTFFIARKLCDTQAAWLAALMTLGSELLWRFSVSGLSTMLLLVIMMGLVWCLMKLDEIARAETPHVSGLLVMAAVIGLLAGLGMLTRYSFGWLVFPVGLFLGWSGGVRRVGLIATAGAVFLLVIAPWLIRNHAVGGTFFGTTAYACLELTPRYEGNTLMQSLSPLLTGPRWVVPCCHKLLDNLHLIFQGELLPTLGWGGVLFFPGLLLGWRNVTAQRLRYFVLASLAMLAVAEALGRTNLSLISPEVNSENLLVLLIPLANIFGVGFFLTLADKISTVTWRYAAVGALGLVVCASLVLTAFAKGSPRSYPPYYPPEIQKMSGWMQPDELMMSDIPWAVAWYGNKPCVWLTLNANSEFFALNDYIKPVNGLYLSTLTLDDKFLNEMVRTTPDSWQRMAFRAINPNAFSDGQFMKGFPLTSIPPNALQAAGLFMSDRIRWVGEQPQ